MKNTSTLQEERGTHTRGPWTVANAVDIRNGRTFPFAVDAERTRIANIFATHPDMEHESKANAYLIAAAPELLEACQSILKDGEDWLSEDAAKMLRAAIAKAKGGVA